MSEALRVFLTLATLLFGGMGAGILLAALLAPGSDLAGFIGLLMLPLCLGVGMTAWHGTASAAVWKRIARGALRARRGADLERSIRESLGDLAGRPPPGTHVFVVASLAISVASGLIVAILPSARDFALVLGGFAGTGLGYGLLLRKLARDGKLPMPDRA